ncbi:spinster family MFS transporter [Rhodospirillum centenum]|uniref:Major facilitator superfamily transport protein n=1 Tax=Rhodospirillum centenum (strain ATCC 51521 / SW) TaxID=414684 RepID=B6IV91_RHOCS|nr:MFS transporter [Rhodospirillum centenum]ACJ00215.1 major facilitator superfamily transport protein [Rhodospirillum centenum SW]
MTAETAADGRGQAAAPVPEPATVSPGGTAVPAPGAAQPPYPRPLYAWYVVGVLMLLYVVSFVDRLVINLLVEPIKRDLQVSDFEIGLLSGLSFALLYTLLGLPAGRLSDRYSRRWIIAGGVLVWSCFAAACGMAKTYWHLMIARMGVGVGEAALSPAAYSLLPDYFPPDRLGRAYSVYGTGITVGSGVAFIVGGLVVGFASAENAMIAVPLLGEVRPWQFVFLVTGLPGIPLALLMLTVKEPVRRGRVQGQAQVPFRAVLAHVRARAGVMVPHFLACGLMSLVGYGTAAWMPALAVRTFGTPPGEVGLYLGGITILFATAGMFTAGFLADRLTRAGAADAPVRVCLWVALAASVFSTAVPLMPSETLLWSVACLSGFVGTAWAGVGAAAANLMTPGTMRGLVSALYLFVVNIVGLGLGPAVVGGVTDWVFGDPALVRYSLALVSAVCLPLAALLYAVALPGFRRSVGGAA